jgi:tetratricopeptide (TPR) repeat protein
VALMERLATEPHTRRRCYCSPRHTDSAFYPIIGQVQRAAGLAHDDSPQTKLDKLDAVLAQTSTSIQDAALIAEMLSLPNDGRYPALALEPQQRRQRTLEALILQLEALTRSRPVLLIFEDAHWSDPTSLEAFSRIVDRIATLRALLIVTFRPEFDPPWIARPHVTTLIINRLPPREVGAMIDRLVGNKLLPTSIRQDIVERSDGIPLFVEEMTKSVLEAESEGEARHTVAAVPSAALAVPASLHASLMARLDRLGPAKEVAQIAAAIGREFSYELLSAVGRLSDDELQSGLDRLIGAGLLFCRGAPPHATYLFKHALVQDVAYGSVLKSQRQQLHAGIARALEALFPTFVHAQPEVVAHHYSNANLGTEAIGFWLKAGQLANDQSANKEAVSHLSKGLALLGSLPIGRDRDALELKLRSSIAPAFIATKGYGASESVDAYESARTLMHVTSEYSMQAAVLAGLYAVYVTLAEYEKALDVAEECLTLAERRKDAADLCVANRLLAVSHDVGGNFPAACHHGEQAWAFYDPDRHGRFAWWYAQDIGVAAGSFLSIALSHLGCFDRSRKLTRDVVELAERLGHHNTIGYAHCCAGALPAFFIRDFQALRRHASYMQTFGLQHHLPQWVSWGACLEAPGLAAEGKLKYATKQIETGLELRERINNKYATRLILTGAAKVHLCAGRADEALALIGKLLGTADNTYERWTNAELWRLRADSLLAAEGTRAVADAEACCRRALLIAADQGSRMLQLRAATSLARLMAERGERDGARELVDPIFNSFTEGFDTPDLSDARSLLDELS